MPALNKPTMEVNTMKGTSLGNGPTPKKYSRLITILVGRQHP